MKNEIEVKFLEVDVDDIRQRLTEAGGHLEQPMRLMKRVNMEEPYHTAEHAFLRIRDEGDKTTLTFKRRSDQAGSDIHGVKEIELEIGDFDTAVELFREAGWPPRTFQESRRETWMLDGAEVVIDEWPWIKPYVEVEAESEAKVREVSEKLGFKWDDRLIGHIDHVYMRDYEFLDGIRGVIDLAEVRFDDPLPAQFKPKGEVNGS